VGSSGEGGHPPGGDELSRRWKLALPLFD
jgi:hypothetical protein